MKLLGKIAHVWITSGFLMVLDAYTYAHTFDIVRFLVVGLVGSLIVLIYRLCYGSQARKAALQGKLFSKQADKWIAWNIEKEQAALDGEPFVTKEPWLPATLKATYHEFIDAVRAQPPSPTQTKGKPKKKKKTSRGVRSSTRLH